MYIDVTLCATVAIVVIIQCCIAIGQLFCIIICIVVISFAIIIDVCDVSLFLVIIHYCVVKLVLFISIIFGCIASGNCTIIICIHINVDVIIFAIIMGLDALRLLRIISGVIISDLLIDLFCVVSMHNIQFLIDKIPCFIANFVFK